MPFYRLVSVDDAAGMAEIIILLHDDAIMSRTVLLPSIWFANSEGAVVDIL
jgi:hypothetical protein